MPAFRCAHCDRENQRLTGEVNRARKRGAPLYCDLKCAGLARRKNKTLAQKREEKRLYDERYRANNRALLKTKKAAHFQRTYDPVLAAVQRKARMPQHVEYCRRPAYRKWKQQYDRQYRAKKRYGAFWECFLLAMDIRDEVLSRQSDYEIRLEKGTFGKSQQRKRDDNRTHREELEVGPVGNLAGTQGRQDGSQPRGLHRYPGPRNIEDYEHTTSCGAPGQAARC